MAKKVVRTKDLPIYKAGYDLVKLITDRVRHFPRDYRPTLGKIMQEEAISLVLSVYQANAATDKIPHLEGVLERLSTLEMLTQLAMDFGQLPPNAFAEAVDILGSIGRQAGGWKNYAKRTSIEPQQSAT